jgi:hypothetical protein
MSRDWADMDFMEKFYTLVARAYVMDRFLELIGL